MSISNVSYSTQVVYGYQSSATNKSAAPRNAGANEQVQGERQKTANPVAQDTAAGRSKFDSVQAAIDDIYKAAKDGAFGPLGETIMSGVENIIQGATSLSPNGSNITYGPKPNITHGSNNGALGYHGDDLDRVLTHLQNNFGMSADQAKKWLAAAGSLSTTNTNGYSGVANSLNIGAPDTAATQAAQIIGAIESAKELAAANASGTLKQDPAAVVNLENKVMDFTSMLPEGMRSLLSDLNASDSEKNSFVNVMVFGNEDGPHGKMATEYFGASSMTGAQLSEKLSSTIEMAKVNPAALQSKDYNYLLRHSDSDLGNSLALEAGASLQERTLDRSLDDTFRSDMAMMQILGRSTAQSASLF